MSAQKYFLSTIYCDLLQFCFALSISLIRCDALLVLRGGHHSVYFMYMMYIIIQQKKIGISSFRWDQKEQKKT